MNKNRYVLDTSVIIKSIFMPPTSLSNELRKREMETHKKCKNIIKMLGDPDIDVYIPKVCVVETSAVAKRLSDKKFAVKISKSVMNSYEVVDESILFEPAWAIAIDTGCSGFDSYFIALAKIKSATLFSDDKKMHFYAKDVGINSILIREREFEEIEKSVK